MFTFVTNATGPTSKRKADIQRERERECVCLWNREISS